MDFWMLSLFATYYVKYIDNRHTYLVYIFFVMLYIKQAKIFCLKVCSDNSLEELFISLLKVGHVSVTWKIGQVSLKTKRMVTLGMDGIVHDALPPTTHWKRTKLSTKICSGVAVLNLAAPCTARTSLRNKLSNGIKIAQALTKSQFQNQGEAACDVPEMFFCLRGVCSRGSRDFYVKFILLLWCFHRSVKIKR